MGEVGIAGHEEDASTLLASSVQVIAHPAGAQWIGVLRRMVEPLGLTLVSARSIEACRQMLDEWPASLLVLELVPRDIREQLRLLAETRQWRPKCRIVLFQRGIDSSTELLARELGVCDVVAGVAELNRLKWLARAHVAKAKQQHDDLWSQILRDVELTTLGNQNRS